MPEQSELERTLAALDHGAGWLTEERVADAARLLREMAADFDEYAQHQEHYGCRPSASVECSCGLDAARARWRLT